MGNENLVSKKWTPSKSEVESFICEDEETKLHVIKTGFDNLYLVVYEDAYEQVLGDTELGSKEELEVKFNIKLN